MLGFSGGVIGPMSRLTDPSRPQQLLLILLWFTIVITVAPSDIIIAKYPEYWPRTAASIIYISFAKSVSCFRVLDL